MRTKTGPSKHPSSRYSTQREHSTAALTLGWLFGCERTQISRSFVLSSPATRWHRLPTLAASLDAQLSFLSFETLGSQTNQTNAATWSRHNPAFRVQPGEGPWRRLSASLVVSGVRPVNLVLAELVVTDSQRTRARIWLTHSPTRTRSGAWRGTVQAGAAPKEPPPSCVAVR